MRFLVMAAILFSASGAFADTCAEMVTTLYTVSAEYKVGQKNLSTGTKVQIKKPDGTVREAYFLGISDGRAYFAPIDEWSPTRPVFYIHENQVSFQSGSDEISSPLNPAKVVEMISAEQPLDCAPQSVLACLTHLSKMGLLSGLAEREINGNRNQLFQEMMSNFAALEIERSEGSRRFNEQMDRATSRREFREVMEAKRNYAFGKIVEFLRGFGVKARVTSSYGDLIRHLNRGKPAYISTNVTSRALARPHEIRWTDEIPFDDDDVQDGSIPVPRWAPSSGGFHAVFAFSILPRGKSFARWLLGKQIVVLDPIGQRLNVWPTTVLRFSNTARFILIGE